MSFPFISYCFLVASSSLAAVSTTSRLRLELSGTCACGSGAPRSVSASRSLAKYSKTPAISTVTGAATRKIHLPNRLRSPQTRSAGLFSGLYKLTVGCSPACASSTYSEAPAAQKPGLGEAAGLRVHQKAAELPVQRAHARSARACVVGGELSRARRRRLSKLSKLPAPFENGLPSASPPGGRRHAPAQLRESGSAPT